MNWKDITVFFIYCSALQHGCQAYVGSLIIHLFFVCFVRVAQYLRKVLGLQAMKVWFAAALDTHVAHEEISL